MQPEERDAALLWDMLSYSRVAQELVRGGSLDDFLVNCAMRLASERALEIVGEAANHVSEAFRAAHPEISWSDIVGLRNVLIHGYSRVDHEIVWAVLMEHLPQLISRMEPLIPTPPSEPGAP
jgi:uncharacterized protein with HEPN domain